MRELLNKILKDEEFQAFHNCLNSESIFSVLDVETWELSHTHLLSWLLNPSAGHGMGSFPLRSFLELAARNLKECQPSFSPKYSQLQFIDHDFPNNIDLNQLTVMPEYSLNLCKNEEEQIRRGRNDVLVYQLTDQISPYLVVEYKVDANENGDQIETYVDFVTIKPNRKNYVSHPQLNGRSYHPLMVYLCKDDRKDKPAEPFVVVKYGAIKEWVAGLKTFPSKTERGRFLVEEYSLVLDKLSPSSGKINCMATLLKEKYLKHFNAISENNPENINLNDETLKVLTGKYKSALEIIGFPIKAPARNVILWDEIFNKIRIDTKYWEVKGKKRSKMVHNLHFREALAASLQITDTNKVTNPRLQLYVDANKKPPKLYFYWNRKDGRLSSATVDELAKSFRHELHGIPHLTINNEATKVVAHLFGGRIIDAGLDGKELDQITQEFDTIVKNLQCIIQKWVNSDDFKMILSSRAP